MATRRQNGPPARRWLSSVAVALAVLSAAPAGAAWRDTVVLPPFICRAEFPLAEQAWIKDELTRLWSDVRGTLALEPPRRTIDIYLFGDVTTYRRYLETVMPGVPYRRALFVDAGRGGRVFAYLNRELAVDLRHEVTHALLHADLHNLPLWLDEGLAEYFEASQPRRTWRHAHLPGIDENLRQGLVPRLAALEQLQALREMGPDEYRDAWGWVHFLLHGPEPVHAELRHYLDNLRAGRTAPPLSARLESRLPDVEARFATYFRQWGERP
ncbi:MAG: DUF1570 domain-containing protein [Pirellulales bacterium]|nr:DUF1570 domain-containing protein [Pirellulales bacterium]